MAINLKAITSCLGYQRISSLSSATALTVPNVDPVSGLNAKPTIALITPETQNVRWRDDGTDPTASVGMPIYVGTSLLYDGNLANLRFINMVAGGKVNVSYYA